MENNVKNTNNILGALCGLARACVSNPYTEKTDALMTAALAACAPGKSVPDDMCMQLLEKIHAEKNAVAPDCAHCLNPCGNTADYDMERLEKDVSDVGVLKRRLLQACCLAARSGSQTELFYTILRMVSYELDAQAYLPLLSEIEKINQTNQEKKQ